MKTINTKVGIKRFDSYDPEEIYKALKEASSAAGLPETEENSSSSKPAAGKTVLLKPNILMDAAPEKAITTHPAFLEACIRLVREWGASRILVGDSPGLQGPNFTAKAAKLGEVTTKNGAEWVDFTRNKMELNCQDGIVQGHFTVSAVLKEADWVISLPKMKTHQLMYYTGAMKNLFGLVPSVAKSPYHVRYSERDSFAAMIVDLNLAVKPVYTMMDAITAMEGEGPASGTPKQVGLVLASANILAADVAACIIMGYPPEKIPVNREALVRQFWLKKFSEISYPLLNPQELILKDYKKIPFKASGSQLLDFVMPGLLRKLKEAKTPKPSINDKTCLRCGDCIKICASGAMGFKEKAGSKQVEIDYKRCIRCYCCHEICPHKAISVSGKQNA